MIKRLVTKESLEKRLGAFQEKIVKKIVEKIVEQNGKIKELQSKVVMKDNAYQKLEIKCNDIEQCSCRLCMLIYGVEYNENDDVMNIMNKVEKCCDEIDVAFDPNQKDRMYHIGKPVFDSVTKHKVRSIKFK